MKINTYQLLAATLLISSGFSGIKVAFAQTAADTTISNTATATYSDGSTTYNATSNTVTVKVAEVPGINVTAQSPSNLTPNAGDTLYVDFTITNVGNDPTQFFIPGTARLSNGTSFSINGSLQIIAVNGSSITPVTVPAGGGTTGTLLSATQGSIPPNGGSGANGTITVRVPIRVNGTATSGASTTVSLGDTATPNAQNVDRSGNVNNTLDVYTVDNADTTPPVPNETPGVLTQVNEAMATSSAITVNARLQSFATLLKAVSSYSNNNTPSTLSDDTLTYSLALRVENPTPPPSGLVASDLHPTAINLDGGTANQNRILISDAIPANTTLSTTAPIAPDSTWEVVYTTSLLSIPAYQANWVTTRPTSGTITRVGFIRSTAIARGTSVSGFSFTVNPISGFTGGRIANIAQVFGQSQPGTVAPGTSTQLVYDESGDQAYNNQLEGGNPDPVSGGAASTGRGISTGVASPPDDGIDPGTGTNPTDPATTNRGQTDDPDGGEVTVYTIAAAPLNGPNGRPDAINTTNNDDFTNRSIVLPVGLNPGTPLDDAQTPATTFTNTVQNTSGSAATISLIPIPPTAPNALPPGTTTVTITSGSNVAVYEYNGTSFTYVSGTNTSATNPVRIPNIAAGETANYTVTIDLPGEISQTTGYSVPIVAFIDENNNGNPSNEPSNITINRLYTGYVGLEKDARILDGATVIQDYTTDETLLSAAARPGRIIEYRIRYRNVSTLAPNSSGSVDLPANNLAITEDGATAPNNWFTSTRDSVGGTLPGSATATRGTISGTDNINGDIQIYINTITTLAPQQNGEFLFRRRIR